MIDWGCGDCVFLIAPPEILLRLSYKCYLIHFIKNMRCLLSCRALAHESIHMPDSTAHIRN